MSDEIARAVEDGAEDIGKAVGGDFAKAYQNLLHDTGSKLDAAADAHLGNESRIVDSLSRITENDEGRIADEVGSSRIGNTLDDAAGSADSAAARDTSYAGNPDFRSSEEDRAAFRSQYGNYDTQAAAVRDVVAQHPELQGIPEEDLVGVRGYTTNDYYKPMNAALRDGDPAGLATYDPHIRTGTSGLNQLPQYEGAVSRGINPADPAAVASHYEPGTTVTENPFTSTDTRQAFPGSVQFNIQSHTGRDVSNLSEFGGAGPESEVLFPPGTKFNVLSRTYDSTSGQWTIGLEEAP